MGLIVVLAALIFCGIGGFLLWPTFRRALPEQPLYSFAVSSLAGMLGLGTAIYFLGMISTQLVVPVAGFFLLGSIVAGLKQKQYWTDLRGSDSVSAGGKLVGLFIVLFLFMPLVGVLTPSTTLDWDSLAYHLAVPKLWIQQGSVSSISFIHHSNFPAAMDALFLLGESIAPSLLSKAFVWSFTVLSSIAVFALVRSQNPSQQLVPYLATMAFVSVPMIIWESGTAYIDVVNGVVVGLGFVHLALFVSSTRDEESNSHHVGHLTVGAIFLGLGLATKYTGLQALLIAYSITLVSVRSNLRMLVMKSGFLAAAIGGAWYLKNWATVGNPVYPFFFSIFGGKNWDAFSAAIYSEEQKTFGFQGITNLGMSIVGLAITPGKFTNPGPIAGTGFAFVSTGFFILAGFLASLFAGIRQHRTLAMMVLTQLLIWSLLSQQSRYILTITIPMIVLTSELWTTKILSKVITVALAVQCLGSLWLFRTSMLMERLPVLIGALNADEFLGEIKLEDGSIRRGAVAFYPSAKFINEQANVKKVALFDEVFGYFLDKPYLWANPGHTTELGYSRMRNSDDLIQSLQSMGVTHVYFSNQFLPPDEAVRWEEAALGLDGSTRPYSQTERDEKMADLRTAWRLLLAEAIASKSLTLVNRFSRTRFLFRIDSVR